MKNGRKVLTLLIAVLFMFSFSRTAFAEYVAVTGSCPYCGSLICVVTSGDNNECPECGNEVGACEECHALIKTGVRYCDSCAQNIKNVKAALATVSVVAFIVIAGAIAGSYPGAERKMFRKRK